MNARDLEVKSPLEATQGPLLQAGDPEVNKPTAASQKPSAQEGDLEIAKLESFATETLRLRSGYSIESTFLNKYEMLKIRAPDGQLCLKVALTPDGPELQVSGVSLSVAAQQNITLDCERLELNARDTLDLRAGADLRCSAAGDVSLEAKGNIVTEGFEQHIRARLGDVTVKANDDVSLDGERIRLNSPTGKSQVR